ncbi:type II toxin-antitoxin system VapC family toxin [Deinococcus sp.]|uniref:type II toxin-antitoxin system VapC family toxin n=1 Tax=Deinococcus sp. TaxID=47478 RepID=UPI0025D4FFC5|nr:type II toxin-antitoxin system VapC family toxin [Deinococcus sp.]
MSTALDSNILNALLRREATAPQIAALLGQLQQTQGLTICPVVYAELLAGPSATPDLLKSFLTSTGIILDEHLPLSIWEAAGKAYGDYALRRKQSGGGLPRRLLADFVVGAHAFQTCTRLVTLDPQHYRLGFPTLDVITL